MNSKLFRLNLSDWWKGLFLSILGAITPIIWEALSSQVIHFDLVQIRIAAVSALSAYLAKNLFSNSKGQVFKKEPK